MIDKIDKYLNVKKYVNEEELDMRTIKRYIPTGAKVGVALGTKSLKLTFIDTLSAPPMTTSDVKSAEMRLKKNVELFVKDVGASIKLKGVDYDTYVFLQGQKNSIDFIYSFRLNVSTKPEEKKLEKIYQALSGGKVQVSTRGSNL